MLSASTDVRIRIRSAQYAPDGGQQEEIRTESAAQGAYYERNGAHYLLWEERMEGVDAPVQSRMKYRNGCLEVTRRGGVSSQLVFEAGKTYRTDYVTALGTLRMEIATDNVTFETVPDGTRRVTAGYCLCQEGEPVAECRLEIEIRPE